MPAISRYFIRTGLIYLVIALLTATIQALNMAFTWKLPLSLPFPTYVHLLTVGWLTQLIFGVMLWMFPKYSKEQPRGNLKLNWAVFTLLNLGLVLRIIAEPNMGQHSIMPSLMALSALLQTVAIYGFVFTIWQRVKER